MCCGIFIARTSLFIFNIFVMVIGGIVIGFSTYLTTNEEVKAMVLLLTNNNTVMWDVGVSVVLGVGIAVMIAGFLGCCGGCKESTWMLCWYSIALIAFLVIEVVGIVALIIFQSQIQDKAIENMKTVIQDSYPSDSSNSDLKEAVDVMQNNNECCGAENALDWDNSTYQQNTKRNVPFSCCIRDEDGQTISDEKCSDEYNKPTSNYVNVEGCYEIVITKMKTNFAVTLSFVIVVIVAEALAVTFACCVRKNKLGPSA